MSERFKRRLSPRWPRWLVGGALSLIFGGGLVLYFFFNDAHLFPLTSWFLCSTVANRPVRYDVEIIASPNLSEPGPISIQKWLRGRSSDYLFVTLYELLQRMGRAQARGDFRRRDHYRAMLEKNHIVFPARYRFVRKQYDPLEYYRSGAAHSFEVLEEFNYVPR